MIPAGAIAFLKSIPWRVVGIVAAVVLIAAIWFRGSHYQAKYEAEHKFAEAAVDINHSNALIDAERDKQVARGDAVGSIVVTAHATQAKHFNAMKAKVANAKPDEDGPIAPILRHALDWLPNADPDEAGPDAPAVHSHSHADLQGPPGAAGSGRHAEGRSS